MSLETLKAAKKVIGVKQTVKVVEREMANLVLIARDADGRVTASLKELCARKNVTVQMVSTMFKLGRACGIHVGAAAVAVLKKD